LLKRLGIFGEVFSYIFQRRIVLWSEHYDVATILEQLIPTQVIWAPTFDSWFQNSKAFFLGQAAQPRFKTFIGPYHTSAYFSGWRRQSETNPPKLIAQISWRGLCSGTWQKRKWFDQQKRDRGGSPSVPMQQADWGCLGVIPAAPAPWCKQPLLNIKYFVPAGNEIVKLIVTAPRWFRRTDKKLTEKTLNWANGGIVFFFAVMIAIWLAAAWFLLAIPKPPTLFDMWPL
jgi:hypothetical protein